MKARTPPVTYNEIKKFSPLECEQIIKDKYDIDLRAEFRPQVEVKRR